MVNMQLRFSKKVGLQGRAICVRFVAAFAIVWSMGCGSSSSGQNQNCGANTSSDAKNCGRCGHDCLGGTCQAGACQPVTLASGLAGPVGVHLDDTSVFWVEHKGGTVMKMPKT